MSTLERRATTTHRRNGGSHGERITEASVLEAVRTNPYAALGAAAAAGFVLGGGLFSRLGLHLMGMGIRAVLIPAATKLLLEGARAEGDVEPEDVDPDDEIPT